MLLEEVSKEHQDWMLGVILPVVWTQCELIPAVQIKEAGIYVKNYGRHQEIKDRLEEDNGVDKRQIMGPSDWILLKAF